MEKKKKSSASWILAKINLGIFVIAILPAIVYVRYIALSSKIWSAKLPIIFLQVLIYPFIALAAVGSLVSTIGLIYKKRWALISFIVHLLLLILYVLIGSGNLMEFLVK